MFWADELAASLDGAQVVNNSKDPLGHGPCRQPARPGDPRRDRAGPPRPRRRHDPPLRRGRHGPDGCPGAPHAQFRREHEMGRPLAHVPDQAGDCHASYARHHAQTFIDVFAGLGIHPDRYYWMSDIYPTGAMDPFIRTALDRAQVVRDVYLRVSRVERAPRVAPGPGRVSGLRQGGHHESRWTGTARPCGSSAGPRLRHVGARLRLRGSGLSVRRELPSCTGTSSGPPSGAISG